MFDLIAEAVGPHRKHLKALQALMKQTTGTVRVASPYVTETKLMSGMTDRDLRLLTSKSRRDFVSGASSLDALGELIKSGVVCRYVPDNLRLHAKVYLFEEQFGVVTSANLTWNALNHNIEVGVHLSGEPVHKLISWFDELWCKNSEPLSLADVLKWQEETEAERAEHSSRWEQSAEKPLLPASPTTKLRDLESVSLFEKASQFFVCNTNRRDPRGDEERMHEKSYAAAWEPFGHCGPMKKVAKGDAIFMYANGFGIIGIGRAEGKLEICKPNSPDRVTEVEALEWRVKVAWLAWTEPNQAFPWKSAPPTFYQLRGIKYEQMRSDVMNHFLSLAKANTPAL